MPEMAVERALLDDDKRFRGVAMISAAVCGFAGAGEAFPVIAGVIKMQEMASALGGDLPAAAQLAVDLGPLPVALFYGVLVVGAYVLFYRLAKKFWVGLLFVPVFIYWATTSMIVGWMAVAQFALISNSLL